MGYMRLLASTNHMQQEEGKDSNDPGWCIREKDGVIWVNTVNLAPVTPQSPLAKKNDATRASGCADKIWLMRDETQEGMVTTGNHTNKETQDSGKRRCIRILRWDK